MSLDAILDAIAAEADAETASLREEAARRREEIIATARRRVAEERERLVGERRRDAEVVAERVVNRARLDAERGIRAAREGLYAEAVEAAVSRLARLRDEPGYPDVLAALLAEADAAFPPGTAGTVVHVDPRDAALAGELAGGRPVLADLETAGGVDVDDGAGRRVRNTVETRLGRADGEIRRRALAVLPELGGTP